MSTHELPRVELGQLSPAESADPSDAMLLPTGEMIKTSQISEAGLAVILKGYQRSVALGALKPEEAAACYGRVDSESIYDTHWFKRNINLVD